MKVRANGIDVEVEDTGGPGPAVLLLMGLGMQLVAWPPAFVQALADAGWRVVRPDNRDAGLTQHFDHLGRPNVLWQALKYRFGLPVRAPYTLADMAADSLGVLDALGIERAHVVGASMGGMVAQRVALAAPARVLSLTSLMSSSGARGLPQARPEVMKVLLGRPASQRPEDVAEHFLQLFRVIGSPAFPSDEAEMRGHILAGIRRSYRPAGTLRQMVAVAADTGRAALLPRISAPTLVLHGKADPLLPYPCGEDTARRIPGARLVGIEGMGHDLPPGAVQRLLPPLLSHLQAA